MALLQGQHCRHLACIAQHSGTRRRAHRQQKQAPGRGACLWRHMRRIPVYERTPIGGLVSSGEDLASHPHLDQVVEASQAAQHGGGPAREGSLSSLKEKRPSAQPYGKQCASRVWRRGAP